MESVDDEVPEGATEAQAEAVSDGAPASGAGVEADAKENSSHGRRGHKRRRSGRTPGARADYPRSIRHNVELEAYYKAQGIVPNDEELSLLFETLREPLPTAFRITASAKMAAVVQRQLETDFTEMCRAAVPEEEGKESILRRLQWYPDGLGWMIATPRRVLRTDEQLYRFHKFLIAENDMGTINRQEAVSMLPPLLLDMQPGMKVIDLCAAPGSKTAQLLDMVQGGTPKGSGGLVIANDADLKRCWMLTHQLKRFARPDLVVTNHEAQSFPSLPDLEFDRVLCDVPCSGDGTLRKAPDLWNKWTPATGLGLHRLQIAIAERGLQLLKPGGRMVYSTCSMNPVENEAVVSALLDRFGSEIELVDVSAQLTGLKRRPGMSHWRVRNCAEPVNSVAAEKAGAEDEEESAIGEYFDSFESVPLRRRKKVKETLFPPTDQGSTRAALLKRCLRVLPHDQDTGAFFVAVLDKKSADKRDHTRSAEAENVEDVSAAKSGVAENRTDAEGSANDEGSDAPKPKQTREKKRSRGGLPRVVLEDPLVPLAGRCEKTLDELIRVFALDPELARAKLMTRSAEGDEPRKIYIVAESTRDVVGMGASIGRSSGLRVVFAGVRAFELTTRDNQRSFRLASESLNLVLPLMRDPRPRVVTLKTEAFLKVAASDKPVLLSELGSDSGRDQLAAMDVGSCAVVLEDSEVERGIEAIVAWRGQKGIGVSVPREELAQLRRRLGIETS